jgi:hypothetical protein
METKKLLIPVRFLFAPRIQMRSSIRTYFEKDNPGPEIVRVHFLENKCFVQIDKPVLEYSSHHRLQYHLIEESMTEYDIIPRNRREIAEA